MIGSHRISKLIAWLIFIPLAFTVAFFAIANRQNVTIDLWPLPFAITLPLFIVVLSTVIFGFLVGALIHWIIAGRLRLRAARAERRVDVAQRELAHMKAERDEDGKPAEKSLSRLTQSA